MKTTRVGIDLPGLRGMLAAVVAATLTSSGCIVVADDGYSDPPPSSYGYDPVIYEAGVYCDYDGYYQEYYWDIYALVDDPDGDVVDVYADVYDYVTNDYLESHDLAYDGGDQWSNRIYERYSDYLTCVYASDFDFDIYAVDSSGAYDAVTAAYIP